MMKNNIIEQNREETNKILINNVGMTIEQLQKLSNDELIVLLKEQTNKDNNTTPSKPKKIKSKKTKKVLIHDNKRSIIVSKEIKKFKEEAQSCKIKGGKIFLFDTLELALSGTSKNSQKLLSKQLNI